MEGFLLAYTVVVGLVLLGALGTLVYSVNKVLAYRKPIYWIAIPMDIALIVSFSGSILRRFVNLPENTITFALLLAFFLIGLLLILFPYVDRLEARRLNPTDIVKTAQDPHTVDGKLVEQSDEKKSQF